MRGGHRGSGSLVVLTVISLALVYVSAAAFVCESGYEGPTNYAKIQSGRVAEASGLASSRKNKGILWTHEDMGAAPLIYGISLQSSPPGAIVSIIDMKGVTKHKEKPDFEDIAVAKCPHLPDQDCIWMGDIGDNCARLQSNGQAHALDCGGSYYLYAVPEPNITRHEPEGSSAEPGDVFEVQLLYPFTGQYPHLAMDSEALVVAPDGSKAWLIEKRLQQTDPWQSETPARIFETSGDLRNTTSITNVDLELVTSINNPDGVRITGADLHPQGTDLIIRTAYHGGTYLYTLDVPFDFTTTRYHGRIVRNSLRQSQPEAVSYDYTGIFPDQVGKGIWHVSEQTGGYQNLEYVKCKDYFSVRELLP